MSVTQPTALNKASKIVHCDCDCFYAAVEMRDDPTLRDLPLAVGGLPQRRGVIATCNYIARGYGVHSAMPSAHARRLCPGLIIVPPNFEKYRETSRQVREIFFDYTDLVEPLSLDEAYLDVTDSTCWRGSATLIARDIRRRVREDIGITLSTGVAPNKYLAKIASDWNKPDGECVIRPDQVESFVKDLPVKHIFGVGKVTAQRMARMGAKTCADLREMTIFELSQKFGRFGVTLHELCRGIDRRKVKPSRKRKSLSVEQTYSEDLHTLEACRKQLFELLIKLKSRLRKIDANYRVTKQFVKLKFNNFQTTTVECLGRDADVQVYSDLIKTAFQRGDMPVRLLGIGVRFIDMMDDSAQEQLLLFEHEDKT